MDRIFTKRLFMRCAIQGVIFFTLGAVLSSVGVGITTGKYWLIMSLIFAATIEAYIDGARRLET